MGELVGIDGWVSLIRSDVSATKGSAESLESVAASLFRQGRNSTREVHSEGTQGILCRKPAYDRYGTWHESQRHWRRNALYALAVVVWFPCGCFWSAESLAALSRGAGLFQLAAAAFGGHLCDRSKLFIPHASLCQLADLKPALLFRPCLVLFLGADACYAALSLPSVHLWVPLVPWSPPLTPCTCTCTRTCTCARTHSFFPYPTHAISPVSQPLELP